MNVKKIKDFLFRVKDTLQIQDEETYKRLTIRIRHQGVSLRDEAKGLNIGTKSQFWAKGGQFIASKIDARWGAFGIIPDYIDKAIITGNFWAYEIDRKQVTMEWFHFFTSTEQFVQICRFASTGVTNRQYLDEKTFLNLEIPLPNLAEQEAIVQKIKGFMATHSQAKAKIEALQIDLKAYRKSILQEAIKGNLTAEWRTNNPTEKVDLKTLKKETTKKQKPLPSIKTDEMPFILPQNWSWVRLGEVCEQITDGTHQTPTYVTKGRIFSSAQNIKPFRFMPENHRFVSEDAYQGYISNRKAELGDVFVARVGAGIGEAAVIDQEIDFAFYVSLGLVKHYRESLNSYYLVTLFNSPYGVGYSKGNISSNGFAGNFNLERIRAFPIPLPPLTEQTEIVRVLEEKMATITAAEEQLKALLAEQSQLQKSMMQEVFRGKITYLSK